jgi:hypothetical protein
MPEIPVYTELASIYGLQGAVATPFLCALALVHGRHGQVQER